MKNIHSNLKIGRHTNIFIQIQQNYGLKAHRGVVCTHFTEYCRRKNDVLPKKYYLITHKALFSVPLLFVNLISNEYYVSSESNAVIQAFKN